MDAHECPDEGTFRVTFPGPFTHHDVVVHGWSVPFLRASFREGNRMRLLLDERLGFDLTADEAERFLPFLADAIAVALGYGAHPREGMEELPPELPRLAPRRVVHVSRE